MSNIHSAYRGKCLQGECFFFTKNGSLTMFGFCRQVFDRLVKASIFCVQLENWEEKKFFSETFSSKVLSDFERKNSERLAEILGTGCSWLHYTGPELYHLVRFCEVFSPRLTKLHFTCSEKHIGEICILNETFNCYKHHRSLVKNVGRSVEKLQQVSQSCILLFER